MGHDRHCANRYCKVSGMSVAHNKRLNFGTFTIAAAALCLAVVSCASPSPSATQMPEASPLIPVTAEPADQLTAHVQLVPRKYAQLAFTMDGIVSKISVKPGDRIEAGQYLISMDSRALGAQMRAAEAALRAASAEESIQSMGRSQWIDGKKVWRVPPARHQLAMVQVEQAQSRLDELKAQAATMNLRAPFDGTVVSIDISENEYARVAVPVITIADLDGMQAETTDFGEKNIVGLATGSTVQVKLAGISGPLEGEVTSVARSANVTEDGATIFEIIISFVKVPSLPYVGMTGQAFFPSNR